MHSGTMLYSYLFNEFFKASKQAIKSETKPTKWIESEHKIVLIFTSLLLIHSSHQHQFSILNMEFNKASFETDQKYLLLTEIKIFTI